MFDFDPNPRKRAPGFTLDKREIARARQRKALSKVEWRLLIFLPILLGLMIWTMLDWREKIVSLLGDEEPIPPAAKLVAMARPIFETLSALPAEAEIAVCRSDAKQLVEADEPRPLTANGLDAITVAWAEARLVADQQVPPLPQRFVARDLVMTDHVRIGSALVLEGRLEERQAAPVSGAERVWQRLLVALDEGQFIEVLAGPETEQLILGQDVRVVGRFMGYDYLPVAGTSQQVPLILGRAVFEVAPQVRPDDPMAEFHRPWTEQTDLWNEVDDARLWTETRPYYYTLGQVLRERSAPTSLDTVPDGNQVADDLHLRPGDFRGKLFRVTGFVYMAWEDHEVARDQPFGVSRVVRVLLWHRDKAPVSETVDGVTTRHLNKLVLRLFELAVITEAPLPAQGEKLSAVGRFLKQRAVAVETNPLRDSANGVRRQSDRVYTWMFVTDGWKHIERLPPYTMGALGWVISSLFLAALIIGIYWWFAEVRSGGSKMRFRVQEMRANRARLEAQTDPTSNPLPADASPPSSDQQAPPPG